MSSVRVLNMNIGNVVHLVLKPVKIYKKMIALKNVLPVVTVQMARY